MKDRIESYHMNKEKLTPSFYHIVNFIHVHKISVKTAERSKLVGKVCGTMA